MALSKAGTAYDLNGPQDAPVVVLIHGLGLTRDSTWKPIIRWLAGRFRVLSYDLPGHGDSALPTGDVSLTALSEQLMTLLDELEIATAALVGFSLGGMINRRVAMDHPDRVSALVVLNSPHERGDEQQALVEARARDSAAEGPGANIDTTLKRWYTPEYMRDNSALVGEVRAVVLANEPKNYAAHRLVLAQGVIELIRPVPPITQPTLVITCAHDSGSTPAMSEAIGAEIAGSEVHIIPGLQHLGLIERPLLFGKRLETFLETTLT